MLNIGKLGRRISTIRRRNFPKIKIKPFKYDFFKSLFSYFLKKLTKLGKMIFGFGFWLVESVRGLKSLVVKKLIWSRGKLGRPIVNLVVLVVAFIVFTFGEILNSSKFVVSKEVN